MTHEDLGKMLDGVAEVIQATHDLERESCDICGETVDFEEKLEEHKKNQHKGKSEVADENSTCKKCNDLEMQNKFKDDTTIRKVEYIQKLGLKLRKMSKEKRTLVMKLKSIKSDLKINEISNGVEKDTSKESKYKCKQCMFNTNIIALMGGHILQKHGDQHKCPQCDKRFSFKDLLKRHMKHKHEIIIIGKKDGSIVGSKQECGECKIKDEVIKHKEGELDKKEKRIKNMTPKTNEIKKYKEEIELARKTIADNVELINLVMTQRDTLKATIQANEVLSKTTRTHLKCANFKCANCILLSLFYSISKAKISHLSCIRADVMYIVSS